MQIRVFDKKTFHSILLLGLGLLCIVFIFWMQYSSRVSSQTLLQAQESFEAAVQASNVIQLNDNLNQALSAYIALDDQYQPMFGDGKLYNNMGEILFSLEQYPWAVLYFYKAHALIPRNEEIELKIQKTLMQLNIPITKQDSIFKKVFFFHEYLSLSERLQILTFCTFLLFGLLSLYVWQDYRFLKGIMAVVLLLWILFLGSVLYTKYSEPLEGVIVQASMLYRGTSLELPLVDPKPIISGYKVDVLDLLEEGKWLKIRTPDGKIGFIPSLSIRLI